MPFKKGKSGNPIGRPKGVVSTTSKLIREHISQEWSIFQRKHYTHHLSQFGLI